MKDKVLREAFNRIYGKEGQDKCEAIIADIKDIFGTIGVKCNITSRVKAPISILNKYNSAPKYANSWNSIKDLIGLMVVVDSNHDIDSILYYINEEFSDKKNPNSELLYRDYRMENYRNKNGMKDDRDGIVDLPSPKGYQVNNGYKNVRINLMIDGYPIEIQVKTKEQHIAHEATHDPVYKSPRLTEKDDQTRIAGGLFPYFEACAHLDLYEQEMTPKQKSRCREDIIAIYTRNQELFQEFADVFNDACKVYSAHMFILKNQDKIYQELVLRDDSFNKKLLESEILRIFHYKEKELATTTPALSKSERFVRTIKDVTNMKYEEFVALREKIAGNHRMENCAIIGQFEIMGKDEINIIKNFSESFRNIQVAIYDDELSELIYGEPPRFSYEDRKRTIESLQGVSNVTKVGVKGNVKLESSIAPMIIEEEAPKQYKIGYLPGVFDILHGQLDSIENVSKICENVIIGAKSDEYIINRKNRLPEVSEEDKIPVLRSIRGIDAVVVTDYDVALPKEVREDILNATKSGEKCAIFVDADWLLSSESKGLESSEELKALLGEVNAKQLSAQIEMFRKGGTLEIATKIPNLYLTCLPNTLNKEKRNVVAKKTATAYSENQVVDKNAKNKAVYEVIALGE